MKARYPKLYVKFTNVHCNFWEKFVSNHAEVPNSADIAKKVKWRSPTLRRRSSPFACWTFSLLILLPHFLSFNLQPTFPTRWWTIFQQISAQESTTAGPVSVTGMSTRWWWALAGTHTTKIPRSPWSVQGKQHSLQTAWCFNPKRRVHVANLFMICWIVFYNPWSEGHGHTQIKFPGGTKCIWKIQSK